MGQGSWVRLEVRIYVPTSSGIWENASLGQEEERDRLFRTSAVCMLLFYVSLVECINVKFDDGIKIFSLSFDEAFIL